MKNNEQIAKIFFDEVFKDLNLTEESKPSNSKIIQLIIDSLKELGLSLSGIMKIVGICGALWTPITKLLSLESPEITEKNIIFMILGVVAILFHHHDWYNKIYNKLKSEGLQGLFDRVVTFFKSTNDLAQRVYRKIGIVFNETIDITNFALLYIPILNGLNALLNKGELTLNNYKQIFLGIIASLVLIAGKKVGQKLNNKKDMKQQEEIKPLDKMPKDFGKAKQINEDNIDEMISTTTSTHGSVVMKKDDAVSNPDKIKKLTDKGINVTLTKEGEIQINENELREFVKDRMVVKLTKGDILKRIND